MSKDVKRALMVARKPKQAGGSYSANDVRLGGTGPSSLDKIDKPTFMGMRPDQLAKVASGLKGYEHLQQAAQDWLSDNPDQNKPVSETVHDILQRQDMGYAYAHGGRTKDERRALMIARDQRALLRRVANIYGGPGGGAYQGPGGGGYAGPGGGKYTGPSRYADGGKVEFKQDNPAVSRGNTEWLASKQRAAYSDPALLRGAVTGYLNNVVHIPVDMLEGVPGANEENPVPGTYKYDQLMKDVKKEGWKPTPILVGVNHKGKPYILEGNHRAAIARALGKTHIPADIRWWNGGEEVEGDWHPKNVVPRLQPYKRADGGSIPPFKLYSGAAKLIEAKGQKKATPQQYAAMPGIKPDELKYAKFEALPAKAQPREEVIKHLEANTVPLQETVYTGKNDRSALARYHSNRHPIVLPGGENYREVLLRTPVEKPATSPELAKARERADAATRAYDNALADQLSGMPRLSDDEYRRASAEADEARIDLSRLERASKDEAQRAGFRGGHWDEPNVLAHLRMSDRKGMNGEKVLHVEEVQSDWGQQGREKGFKGQKSWNPDNIEKVMLPRINDEPVWAYRHPETGHHIYPANSPAEVEEMLSDNESGKPPAGPYVDNTQKWTDLALKRVLHEAAHGNYDKVVFTPGAEQNKRYSLANHVDEIHYDPRTGELIFPRDDGAYGVSMHSKDVAPDKLHTMVGKEVAEKLLATPPAFEPHVGSTVHSLRGKDMEIGGSGMRGYYDDIMPKRLQALAKQHDPQAKVQLAGHALGGGDPLEEHRQHFTDYFKELEGRMPANDSELRAWAQEFSPDDFGAYVEGQPDVKLHSLDVTPQMRDSIKQNGFNQFKRGGDVGMRQRYADGGGADSPVVNKALDLVSMFQPAKPTMAQRVAPPSGEPTAPGSVSIKSLSDAFDRAIQHHTSLSPEERAANSRAALQKIAPYLGKSKTGVPSPLLTKNAKLMKSEAGYKGGDPISLPNGQGVETTGLALAPAYQEGKFTTCPNSASCKKECLGKFAGGYFYAGGGQDPDALKGPRLNSVRKTQAMLREPEAFAVRLHDEIEAAKRMASINNNMLGVRLNVLSDINPRVHKAIIDAHPDVAFYDYTKNNTNPVAPNHHYTYSSTGVSDTDVDNPHSNWKQMRKRLDTGSNVAMAFSHKAHLPETVFDEETGKRYRVVNGDSHDFRPLDIQPKGEPGVIVGLRNKKISSTNEGAHRTSNGFFVKYNPDFLVGNKGKRAKDMHGNPIAQNTEVRIRNQKQAPTLKSNDEAETP